MSKKNGSGKVFALDSCVIRRIAGNQNYLTALNCRMSLTGARILISETAEFELAKHGFNTGKIIDKLSSDLDAEFSLVPLSYEANVLAMDLIKKYSTLLHWPDNLHMAFAMVNDATLLSCDKDLALCCETEGWTCINPDIIATSCDARFGRKFRKSKWRSIVDRELPVAATLRKPITKIRWEAFTI